LANEKTQQQLAKGSKFFREIVQEAQTNDSKKYSKIQIFFGAIAILFVFLPLA